MQEISEHFIDLEKVFHDKNPRLAKALPKFILNYLVRVIHQEDLNSLIFRNREKFGLDFCNAMLNKFQVIINVKDLENISYNGRYIIASTHPLGGLDGMALMSVCGRQRPDIVFPVNDLLMNLPNLSSLFIPINKHGSNVENVTLIEETFASDKLVLYFPAGLCSRKQKGKIMDLQWKKTFVTKAIRYKRDVIPCFIEGRNSNFFYNFANLRKRIGIKSNIEMLYLVDEMFKQKNKTINITFGKPISYNVFDKRLNHSAWAQKLRTYVYEMGKGNNMTFEEYITINIK
jgi:putative hemolysin